MAGEAGFNDASLVVGIVGKADKAQIVSELGKISSDAAKFMTINLSKTAGGMMPKGADLAGGAVGAASKGGGLLGTIGNKFLGLIGPIGLALSVISNMKPITKLLSSLTKMLSAILQPISDVLVTALMPLLGILKPILTVVRAVMAPFRKAALQLSAKSSQSFAAGDMGEGMTLALASFQVLFTGIHVLALDLMSELVQGQVTMMAQITKIISEPFFLIAGLIAGVIDSLTGGKAKAMETVNSAKDSFFTNIDNGIEFLTTQVDNIFGTIIMTQLTTLKTQLSGIFGAEGAAMINMTDFGTTLDAIFTNSSINFSQLGSTIDTKFADLETSGNTVFTSMQLGLESIGTIWSELFVTMYEDVKKLLTANTEGTTIDLASGANTAGLNQDEGFFSKVKEFLIAGKDGKGWWANSMEGMSGSITKGWKHMMGIQDEYWTASIIPDRYELGWKHMNEITKTGINQLTGQMNTFGTQAQTTSTTIQQAVNGLISAGQAAASAIEAAAKVERRTSRSD